MATTDTGTANYRGTLFALGANQAPFMAAIAGKAKRSSTFTFPIAQPYSVGDAAQTAFSEDDSHGALTAGTVTRAQDVNTAQIMIYPVESTFKKQSSTGIYSGINVDGTNPVLDELGFQKKVALIKAAKDMEYSVLQGTYVADTATNVASKTRGLKKAITTNTVAGGGVALEKAMIEELVRKMRATGSMMVRPMIIGNSFQLQRLSDIYGYAPQDRTMGGVAIDRIMVPGAGIISTMFSPQMPEDELYIVDLEFCAPVFVPVLFPRDGNVDPQTDMVNGVDVVFQPTAITSAARGGFFYTQFGFDYGAEEYHGSITGLATSA